MAISGTEWLEVPNIYKAYVRAIVQGYVRGYTPEIWPYMVQYLHFRILEFPLMNTASVVQQDRKGIMGG